MQVVREAGWLFLLIGAGLIAPQHGQGGIPGKIMVFAWDSNSTGTPPPSTTAYLNDTESQAFGTNYLATFSGYFEAGIHTVAVSTEAIGYLPRQSPTDPNAVNDPDSTYGNPRHVEISESTNFVPVSFLFDPVIAASAVVRDAWTMERLDNASIEFIGKTGANAGIVYSEYPWESSYASNWVSNAEGNFPSNTILYLGDYDLNIAKTGYQLFVSNNIIVNAATGDDIDLGTLFLYPIDNNANQIADSWETLHFGTDSTMVAEADADGDGMSNRDEYIAGTNPTNGESRLWAEALPAEDGLALAWYTEPNRTYRVCGTTNLCSNSWVQVGGAWEASAEQIEMVWIETNMNLSWNSNYRIEVVPCWWQGTNQVLINTNMPYRSGTGTNVWEGGPPPPPGS